MAATIISVREVRQLASALFLRMEKAGVDQIAIDQPNYWKVFPDDLFRATSPHPVVASVDDDLKDLRRDDAARSTDSWWHSLAHLSGLITAMAAVDIGAAVELPAKVSGTERIIS
ncbi:MAG TPA: hypothetical protein VMF90_19585 [Rhizobiaceae bacterium]|nr:hypothetical protein [Rhizobiaceae bacterium]